jgi:hypothetical protein
MAKEKSIRCVQGLLARRSGLFKGITANYARFGPSAPSAAAAAVDFFFGEPSAGIFSGREATWNIDK